MKYIFAFLLVLISFPVQAEVFAWKDPEFNITMVYPDDWMYQKIDQAEGIRLHIMPPQAQDEVSCRVFASHDNRFLYVPPKGAVKVAQFVQDEEALKNLLSGELHYTDVRLAGYRDLTSLGKGPATMAVAQYYKKSGDDQIPMQSVVFGGYVQGLETFFQCESQAYAWDKWQPIFMSMASKFDFPVRTAALKNGYYRDFMADGFVYFPVGNSRGTARY